MTNTVYPKNTVHVGFEIPSGEPVEIPINHLCVTGQTQLSGKTTTLEALVGRAGRVAIAFVTKRGEGGFRAWRTETAQEFKVFPTNYRSKRDPNFLKPFFRERADWQFVSDILGAILHEKLKFQRSWIMKVCRGASTLEDVHANVRAQLTRKLRGLDESVYTELDHYFELLLPELERMPVDQSLHMQVGLNVMDLSSYSTALQMLVISSVLEEVYKRRADVVVVIPEAWEFIPNGRNSPVKSAAITLARKGAALKNFIWLDSQDLASIDTEVRRACGVWILGVQRERNEVERVLAHIPGGTRKPKVDDVMHLERGQFYVCHGKEVKKVYVQPVWMDQTIAKEIATGERVWIPEQVTTQPPTDDGVMSFEGYVRVDEPVTNNLEGGGNDVDQQERERYESTINELYRLLYMTERNMPKRTYANGHTFEEWLEDFKHRADAFAPDDYTPPANHARFDFEDSNANMKEVRDQILEDRIRDSVEDQIKGRVIAMLPTIEQRIFDNVMARIPASGVTKVEPKQVVLREFQEAQVDRILESAKNLTLFQKQVLRYAHARGSRATKKDLFKAIVGKDPQGGSVQQSRYLEIDGLVNKGMLRADSGFFYPNLGVGIKAQLSLYEVTNEQVDDVVGQVLLRLK